MQKTGRIRRDDYMPPKLDKGSATERVQIVAPASLLKRIDDWRRKHPAIPNRSEAIRLLVDLALSDKTPKS